MIYSNVNINRSEGYVHKGQRCPLTQTGTNSDRTLLTCKTDYIDLFVLDQHDDRKITALHYSFTCLILHCNLYIICPWLVEVETFLYQDKRFLLGMNNSTHPIALMDGFGCRPSVYFESCKALHACLVLARILKSAMHFSCLVLTCILKSAMHFSCLVLTRVLRSRASRDFDHFRALFNLMKKFEHCPYTTELSSFCNRTCLLNSVIFKFISD